MFDSRRIRTSCAPSNGNEVKEVFVRPGARVMVDMTRKTLAAQVAGTRQYVLISKLDNCLVTVCLNIAECDVKPQQKSIDMWSIGAFGGRHNPTTPFVCGEIQVKCKFLLSAHVIPFFLYNSSIKNIKLQHSLSQI